MPSVNHGHDNNRSSLNGLLLLLFSSTAFIIYALTAQRTFSWWFGSSYPLTAITFGVHFPPGSLILTILGWLVAQLPIGVSKAFTLNIFNGLLAACACWMVMSLALMLTHQRSTNSEFKHAKRASHLTAIAVGAGGLTLALAETMWRYAVNFMPYALTAVFTGLLLWAVLNWWRKNSRGAGHGWLFVLMLLFGLDFSVHRTNLLLLPGVFLWMLLCYPRIFFNIKNWLSGGFGLLIGLSFHLLIIPIAASNPVLNASDPSNWSRFYYYISLEQYGGSWLVNMWPRNAGFFDVQLKDFWNAFVDNFLSVGGALVFVPLLMFVVGIVSLAIKDVKLSFGMIVMLVFSSLGAVAYFNLPENYPYPMDRHYLTSFVIFSLIASYGAGVLMMHMRDIFGRYGKTVIPIVLLLLLAVPAKQIVRNYSNVDASDKYFAHDYAENILNTVENGAIIFAAGDNFWPLIYMQTAENMRPDVVVMSPSLLNTGWYVKQITERNPGLPLNPTEEELANAGPVHWQDSTITTQVLGTPESYQLTDGAKLPATFDIRIQPTVAGQFILFYDWVLLRLIEENQWQRPVYFTSPPQWLQQHTRLEGLISRLIPQDPAELNADILRQNLFEQYSYRGYSDDSMHMGIQDRYCGQSLVRAFLELAKHEMNLGNTAACQQAKQELDKKIFLDRLDLPPDILEDLNEPCP